MSALYGTSGYGCRRTATNHPNVDWMLLKINIRHNLQSCLLSNSSAPCNPQNPLGGLYKYTFIELISIDDRKQKYLPLRTRHDTTKTTIKAAPIFYIQSDIQSDLSSNVV
jgi:hypothetical protein